MEICGPEPSMRERVVPVENMQLMFHYGNPFAVCQPDHSAVSQPRSIISGLSNTYADVITQGPSGVIFVEFEPAGACRFFRFPLVELENKSIDLADIFNREMKVVEDKLSCAATVEAKIEVIELFLLNQFVLIPAHDEALINKGLRIIEREKGQLTAAGLAGELCVSSRTLERKFALYIGMSPGHYCKLFRFRKILGGFGARKNINLTEYACRNGYFDQSHFIHDFKMYSGYTPREFLSAYPDFDPHSNSGE